MSKPPLDYVEKILNDAIGFAPERRDEALKFLSDSLEAEYEAGFQDGYDQCLEECKEFGVPE